MNATRVWIVFNPKTLAMRPPRYIHGCYGTAKDEAERLARENPGQCFHVMASVSASVKHDVSTEWFTDDLTDGDSIPF